MEAPRSERLAALETVTWDCPSWVLSRSRAVLAALMVRLTQLGSGRKTGKNSNSQKWGTHVSFSKVTVALCGLSDASEAGVTEREVILPLLDFSRHHGRSGLKRTRS